LNPNACIIEKPLNQFDAVELLNKYENAATSSKKELNINCCGLSHIHALGSCCIHDHDADEIFDTITIHTKHIFSEEELKKKARAMESMPAGNVLRAKGIIPGKEGYMSLQYVSGEIEITSSEIKGNMLCIIGQNLNRQEFLSLFDGE